MKSIPGGHCSRVAFGLSIVNLLAPTLGHGQTQGEPGGAESNSNPTAHNGWMLREDAQAVERIRPVVGLADLTGAPISAEVKTLPEDNTPFLKHRIGSRPVWHVVLRDVKLVLPSIAERAEDRYTRTFDVFVDPENGQILKIASRWPEGIPEIAPEPSAGYAEAQLLGSGERYHGFPDLDPAVSFLQALDVVAKDGVGFPLAAKQIVGQYVLHSERWGEPKPAWVITLRGITPIRASDPSVPEDMRNHIRNVVDAQTGKWLGAGTDPQPEMDKVRNSGQAAKPSPGW